MGTKKIIQNIVDFLDISNFTLKRKKKALKALLKKLKEKRVVVLRELQGEDCPAKEEQRLREELELLSFHITKAKQKLEDL